MAKSPEEFQEDLLALLEELRPYTSLRHRPILSGEARDWTWEQMKEWQVSYYPRDVGVGLAQTYAKCPHQDARHLIAENLAEEEGLWEGEFRSERTHPNLSKRLHFYFGLTDDEVEENYRNGVSGPRRRQETASMDAGDAMGAPPQDRPESLTWLEQFAGFGLGAEYFVPAVFAGYIVPWLVSKGVPEEVTEFYNVHGEADMDHSLRTLDMVVKYARTDEEQESVVQVLRRRIRTQDVEPLPESMVTELRQWHREHGGPLPANLEEAYQAGGL